jgi:hypothetical protein
MGNEKIIATLRLIERSPDHGKGWRSVSETCWPLMATMPDDLVERPPINGWVRLTDSARAVLKYSGAAHD